MLPESYGKNRNIQIVYVILICNAKQSIYTTLIICILRNGFWNYQLYFELKSRSPFSIISCVTFTTAWKTGCKSRELRNLINGENYINLMWENPEQEESSVQLLQPPHRFLKVNVFIILYAFACVFNFLWKWKGNWKRGVTISSEQTINQLTAGKKISLFHSHL